MSQQDVETIKTAYEAFGRGDLEGAAQGFTDDVEWWSSPEVPEGGTITGKDAVIESWSNIPNYFSEFAAEPREIVDAGEKVFVLGTQRATAKDTGKTFETPYVHVFWTAGGKVTRAEFHSDSALEVKALAG
jgi:ketosteroid isomerase-like protein